MSSTEALGGVFGRLFQAPMPVTHTFRGFIGLHEPLDFTRLHQYPTADEIARMCSMNCKCSVDPFKLCPLHKCTCDRCARRPGLLCEWRQSAKNFIEGKLGDDFMSSMNNDMMSSRITYVQCIELQGVAGPASPRQRNALNIIANLPILQFMGRTNGVLDLGQTLSRNDLRADGLLPTLCKNSALFSLDNGCFLEPFHTAKLMGHKMEQIRVRCVSDTHFKAMLGNSVHVACAGFLIGGAVASLFH